MSAATIYAQATGAGRAAVAIVRLSGPGARDALLRLAGRVPMPRHADLVTLRDPANGEILDRCLVLFFEGPRSETGEDCVEFHLHGGRAVVEGVLHALATCRDLRPAEAGEFARRAFVNGKRDLTQLEGLADLVDAETQWQRRQAHRHLSGAMRDATAPWRAALLQASALVETAIDFAEDVDLADGLSAALAPLLAPIRDALREELRRGRAAERVRDGVQVVIAGPPNAGKSTLLNALVRREAAIVSAIAGTTRDPIEVHLDLAGCPVTLVDTAGLRESDDTIERVGIERARARAEEADLVLWLDDGTSPQDLGLGATVWPIMTKADLVPLAARRADIFPLSASTGENLDVLTQRLGAFARDLAAEGAGGLLARARHRLAFETAEAALARVLALADPVIGFPVELIAEDLRAARFALERLIGVVDVEDILGDIFSRFCIGK